MITFGRDAVREIADTVRWAKQYRLPSNSYIPVDTDYVTFRIGKTTTNTDFATYPTSGDTFVVELGELSWTESTGVQTNTWTAYSPKDTRLCHDLNGGYYAENTYVYLALHHGRWFIISAAAVVLAARITTIGSTAIANTVQAETGTLAYTATTGRQTLTFTADSPQALITVHQMFGPPPRVNDLVIVTSVNGAYQVIHTNASDVLKAVVLSAGGISAGGSGTVSIYKNGLVSGRQETAYANWMATTTIAYNKKCVIRWFDDEQKWVILNAEC